MAPLWLIPALRAVVPHLATIVAAGAPAFSSRTTTAQIEELQKAVATNATNVKDLAEQLQRTVEAVDAAAIVADQRLRLVLWLSAGALVLAALALAVAVVAVTSD